MEHIHLPTTVEFKDTDNPHIGQVNISPCHQGYGTTLGNALRRVLLSSLPGGAVESIKIEGVQHEFSPIEGVLEDVVEIILNFKKMAVRVHSDEPVTLNLTKKGKGEVTPADFDKNSDVEIINPDFKIMTITDDKTVIKMEVTVGNGSGYVPVAEKETKDLPLGTIAIDSLYTPIRDVGYNVELTRVGDITDFEKLIVTIETNGTVTPKEAVSHATKILMDHFALILDAAGGENITPKAEMPAEEEKVEEEAEEEQGEAAEEEKESDDKEDDEEAKGKSKKKKTSKKEE